MACGAVALGALRPLGPFAPQDPKTPGLFGPIVRGVHPVLGEEDPQRVHLAEQAACTLPRLILTVRILVDEVTQPRIPRPPLPARRRAVAI